MNVAQLLDDATTRIAAATGLEKREARLEARVLACHAWRVETAWLIAHDTDVLPATQITEFQTLLSQRETGHPIAYLVGIREFYGRPFQVTPAVLIPRPETELLVELALARIPLDQPIDVLDLGTGSGCIAITLALERPLARVTAVDRSEVALAIAQRNAESLSARVDFMSSDWFSVLQGRNFDLIVSNPPYIAQNDPHLTRGDIRFEPITALVSGTHGLDDAGCLVSTARSHLVHGGCLLLEHGHDQAEAVRSLLSIHGFHAPQSWADLAGIQRVSGGNLSEYFTHCDLEPPPKAL